LDGLSLVAAGGGSKDEGVPGGGKGMAGGDSAVGRVAACMASGEFGCGVRTTGGTGAGVIGVGGKGSG